MKGCEYAPWFLTTISYTGLMWVLFRLTSGVPGPERVPGKEYPDGIPGKLYALWLTQSGVPSP
jgi:hypothetical protein